jgi:hypothetical protein
VPNKQESTNHILGYPDDARLLIVNADDFGMCNSVHKAIMRTLHDGFVRSTTIKNLQRMGLPTIDRDFLDSYGVDPAPNSSISPSPYASSSQD